MPKTPMGCEIKLIDGRKKETFKMVTKNTETFCTNDGADL
jgi:hypothetical protein